MKNNRLQGIIGTVVVHLIILHILFVVTLHAATPDEESGVPVMLGSAELSQGDADPYTLTEVDVLDELQPETAPADPSVETPSEQEMLTQDLEETVAMKPQKNGTYRGSITVARDIQDKYQYRFKYTMPDGSVKFDNDWNAEEYCPNPFGGDNSVFTMFPKK